MAPAACSRTALRAPWLANRAPGIDSRSRTPTCALQPRPTDSITIFGPNAGDRLSAADILQLLNTAVERAPASTQLKSHFTKHSFRHGHVQACLQAAISLSDIMLFSNWRPAPFASNHAQGATHQSSLARSMFP